MPQLEESFFFFPFISEVPLYFSTVQESYFFETQFLDIITFFSMIFNMWFQCVTEIPWIFFMLYKRKNWKQQMEHSVEFTRFQHKILFAGNMDIWCHNSHMARSSDEFSHTFSLSGRILCTFISDKKKLVKRCQKINTEHLNSSLSLWQTTKEPPTRQYTFWRASRVARHHSWKNIF